jgi:hypothetical protein
METRSETRTLQLVERVRCLDCGSAYSKPAAGGTVAANPGCPECGYLGWVPAGLSYPRCSPRHTSLGAA